MTSDGLPHQVRMEMAQFLQHTLDERATQVTDTAPVTPSTGSGPATCMQVLTTAPAQVTAEHRQRERLKEEAEQALNATPSESRFMSV